jgi:rod shape-determining protein MreD
MPFPLQAALTGLLCIAVQWLVLGRLQIAGAYPDGVLLYIAWLGFVYGRRVGGIAGFSLGFLMDAIYGTWGIQMFVKTLLGFIVGLFQANERDAIIVRPEQAFLVGLFISLLHNGLFVALLVLRLEARNASIIFSLWLGSALYTAVLANIVSRFISTR